MDEKKPVKAKEAPTYIGLSDAQAFIDARGKLVALTDEHLKGAAEMLPQPPTSDRIPEQMAQAQCWLAYYKATGNTLGIAEANTNLELIGCETVMEN